MRINWKKESEKAMKCAEGSSEERRLATEQDTEGNETTPSELSQQSGDLLMMKEMDASKTTLSEENTADSEQGEDHYHSNVIGGKGRQ
jgi:hypothetical protein